MTIQKYKIGMSAFKAALTDVIATVGRPTGTPLWIERAKNLATQIHAERAFDPALAFDIELLMQQLDEIHARAKEQIDIAAAEEAVERAVTEEVKRGMDRDPVVQPSSLEDDIEEEMTGSAPQPRPRPRPRATPSPEPRSNERPTVVTVRSAPLGQEPVAKSKGWKLILVGIGIGLLLGLIAKKLSQ